MRSRSSVRVLHRREGRSQLRRAGMRPSGSLASSVPIFPSVSPTRSANTMKRHASSVA